MYIHGLGVDDVYNYDKDYEEQLEIDLFMDKVDNLSEYRKAMFDAYFIKGMSLRDIKKKSSIGLNSIHNTIKDIRDILKGKEVSGYKIKRSNIEKINKIYKTKK